VTPNQAALYRWLEQAEADVQAEVDAYRGSPEAIANCRKRLKEAQQKAQDVLGTYQPSDRSLEWEADEHSTGAGYEPLW
jgi:exonuclease VII small subunit